jgi:DNA-directed RNA polymerase specialized sigma24 family protein
VEQLKKRGLGYREAVETYQKKLYDVIKFHLAQDWECEDGYEDVMKIIREKVSAYY